MSDFGYWGFKGKARRIFELPGDNVPQANATRSQPGRASLRYDPDLNQIQASLDGGAYESIVGGSGAVNDRPVLNVASGLTALGFEANAVEGVAGGGDAIQDAIDYFVANPREFSYIYIPQGVWRLTKPLLVKNGDQFARVNIVGGSSVAFPQAAGNFGAILQLDGGLNADGITYVASDLAVMFVQGAAATSFAGIDFFNTANPTPATIDTGAIPANADITDWYLDGIRTNRYSPCAAVVIDPFGNGNPGGDIDNRYPDFGSQYGANAFSSEVIFSFCNFRGGYVGTVISPSGLTPNGENILFETCYWQGNTISHSQTQSQSRSVELRSPRMNSAFVHLDNKILGSAGSGSAPRLTGTPNVGLCYYFANLQLDVSEFSVSEMHMESTMSLGQFSPTASGANAGAKFSDCLFNFIGAADSGSDEGDANFHMDGSANLTFDNCVFAPPDGIPIKIIGQSNRYIVSFRSCKFQAPAINGKALIGCSFPQCVSLENCLFVDNSQGGVVSIAGGLLDRFITAEPMEEDIVFTPLGGGVTANTATFTVSNAANILVGDIVIRPNTGLGANVEIPRVNPNLPPISMIGPVGIVSGKVGNTVTVTGLSRAVEFGPAYRFRVTRLDIADADFSTVPTDYLAGLVTFSSAATADVLFAGAPAAGVRTEVPGQYLVALSPEANETFWVSGKNARGFTINSSNGTSTATVGWKVVPIGNFF